MHDTNGKINKKKKKGRNLLKDVDVTEVSFVGRGANQGARQSLFKIADKGDVAKRLFNQIVRDAKASEAAQELLCGMLEGTHFLDVSLMEIMEDPRLEQRKDMLRDSIREFSATMSQIIDEAPLTKSSNSEEVQKEATKNFKEHLDGAELDERICDVLHGAWNISGALRSSFEDILKDDSISDKKAEMEEQLGPLVRAYTRLIENIDPNITKEDTMSKEALQELQKKFDDQEAELAKTKLIAGFNDAEKAHYGGLDDDGKAAFEKMDADGRKTAVEEAVAKKAADDETFESEGITISKSEVGPGVFALMKAMQTKTNAAVAKADKLESDSIQKGLEEEAEKLWPNTAGSAADKAQMLKTIRELPEAQQEGQMKMLKAADEAMAKSFKEEGQGGTTEAGSAAEKLEKMAKDLAGKESITFEKAYTKVLDTKEGAKLYNDSLNDK